MIVLHCVGTMSCMQVYVRSLGGVLSISQFRGSTIPETTVVDPGFYCGLGIHTYYAEYLRPFTKLEFLPRPWAA